MQIRDCITGLEHLGIDTLKLEETVAFYSALGFERMRESGSGESKVFMQFKGLKLEITERTPASESRGSLDHMALCVTDIERAFEAVREQNLEIVSENIGFAPFWKNGLRYFKIKGPNGEIVEFIHNL